MGFDTATIEGSGLVDFPAGTTKGIILPQVNDVTTMTETSQGTFVFDGSTAKVKYYDGVDWIELTGKTGAVNTLLPGAEKDQSIGVIIGGAESDAKKGVLVLESADKAMILPKVINPVVNVKSPTAGMMCYDPEKKLVCFYDGVEWAFWGNID
ncbi:hypothetical protein [Chryseobacterium oryctis]|uniref:Uncharacterized protein n=1 Tax=Chryseobacterium oryctis TaxID=2952618 RepID=A0ABT3HP01_9FLAO|nr:hypothetical protein [Chryseobacterium oryctis]MCW3161514.1 hypothetical protein [Chryseobacterium oryctis]